MSTKKFVKHRVLTLIPTHFILQPDSIVQLGLESINQLLENFLGISDDELGKLFN